VPSLLCVHLHWFRLHFGRTSTPFTNDALDVAIVGGVACFVRCPALPGVELLEYRVVGELLGICNQMILKRGHNLGLGENVCITGRESASIIRNEISQVKTYRSKPAMSASSIKVGLRCLVSHDKETILADVYYIYVVA
jgi:hypothetical protein